MKIVYTSSVVRVILNVEFSLKNTGIERFNMFAQVNSIFK